MIHLLVLEWLQAKGVDSLTILSGIAGETAVSCLIGIPVLAIVGYVAANLIVMMLRRIPIIGKYVC